MASALEHLVGLRDAEDRFDVAPEELLPRQLEAVNERLETRVAQIPLLKNRAAPAGSKEITTPADLVPLLLAHNTYKTYPEPWPMERQGDRMAPALQTGSTHPCVHPKPPD